MHRPSLIGQEPGPLLLQAGPQLGNDASDFLEISGQGFETDLRDRNVVRFRALLRGIFGVVTVNRRSWVSVVELSICGSDCSV